MITFKTVIILIVIMILIPYLLGLYFMRSIKDENIQQSLSLSFIMGLFCLFILYYIPAVIMIIRGCTLTLLTNIWLFELIFFSILSILFNRRKMVEMIQCVFHTLVAFKRENWFIKILLVVFLLLVFFQAFLLSYSSLYDTDDARYIAESLDAISTDRMLLTNPLTGETLSEPVGEMIKDIICPFSMLQASVSKISGVHPATLCHVVLPLLMIPLCYFVYWLLSIRIFGSDEREKRITFLIFVCILMMFGRLSAFWNSAYLLWRIWQGKAILAAIVIPFLIYIIQGIMKDIDDISNYIFLFITTFGACILTPMSAIFSLVIIGVYTLLILIYSKRAVILYRMGLCCIPSIMLLILSKVVGMVRYGL